MQNEEDDGAQFTDLGTSWQGHLEGLFRINVSVVLVDWDVQISRTRLSMGMWLMGCSKESFSLETARSSWLSGRFC